MAPPTTVAGNVRSLSQIPSGKTVLIRAFDVAAVSAVLKMSEGRGGQFSPDPLVPRYYRSGHEPLRIDIRNRSGRPLLAKLSASVRLVDDSFWQPHRRRLNSLMLQRSPMKFRRDIWSVFLQAVSDLLSAVGSSTRSTDVDNWYRGWSRYQMDAISARRVMLQSLGVATGVRAVDIPLAVGETWRNLSPHLEELVNLCGTGMEQLDMYVNVREEMRLVAFGPSATATAKLLSLLRSRLVTIGPLADTSDPYDAYLTTPAAAPPWRNRHKLN